MSVDKITEDHHISMTNAERLFNLKLIKAELKRLSGTPNPSGVSFQHAHALKKKLTK